MAEGSGLEDKDTTPEINMEPVKWLPGLPLHIQTVHIGDKPK